MGAENASAKPKHKVGNRPPGGCVGVLADNWIAKTHRQNQNAKRLGNLVYQHVFRPLCFRLASLAENTTAQRSVGYLTLSATPTFAAKRRGLERGRPARLCV
jgi:hypothetical protein